MCCYAGKLLQQPEMNNPTLVVVTDRNNLDGQLYEQFCSAKDLLSKHARTGGEPEQLREMLGGAPVGGIIFTTVQSSPAGRREAHPPLCPRTQCGGHLG